MNLGVRTTGGRVRRGAATVLQLVLALVLCAACKKWEKFERPSPGEVALAQKEIQAQGISAAKVIEREVGGERVTTGRIIAPDPGGSPPAGPLDEVCVIADVRETELPLVKEGAHVSVTVEQLPGRKFEGRIDRVTGALDPATHRPRVRAVLPNPGHELRPDMYATVLISVPRTRGLAVPRDALVRLENQIIVFVVVGTTRKGLTRFARRMVVVDESVAGDDVPVLQGLHAGETVVVRGGQSLVART